MVAVAHCTTGLWRSIANRLTCSVLIETRNDEEGLARTLAAR